MALAAPIASNATTNVVAQASANQVSWPTIFWALVPIALNSMTQPVGRLLPGLSVERSVCLRISPFICVTDSLVAIYQVMLCMDTADDPVQFARMMSEKRFSAPDIDTSTLRSLQENSIFRVIILLFGALPQAVKLFACSGIPLSQALASMFLGSFAILELLVILPQRYSRGLRPEEAQASPSSADDTNAVAETHRAAAWWSTALLFCLLFEFFPKVSICLPNQSQGLFMMSLWGLTVYVFLRRVWGSAACHWLATLYFQIGVFLWALGFSRGEVSRGYRVQCFDFTDFAFLLNVIRLLIISSTHIWTLMTIMNKAAIHEFSRGDCMSFAAMHFMYGFTYCQLVYDSKGTHKPAWTEYLG